MKKSKTLKTKKPIKNIEEDPELFAKIDDAI